MVCKDSRQKLVYMFVVYQENKVVILKVTDLKLLKFLENLIKWLRHSVEDYFNNKYATNIIAKIVP